MPLLRRGELLSRFLFVPVAVDLPDVVSLFAAHFDGDVAPMRRLFLAQEEDRRRSAHVPLGVAADAMVQRLALVDDLPVVLRHHDAKTHRRKAVLLLELLVPLFVSAFRRATDLAMAMEARCYRGGEGRTKMKPLHYEKRDYIAFVILVAYLIYRSSFEHAWMVSFLVAEFLNIVLFLIGSVTLSIEVSIGSILIESVVGVLIAALLQFWKGIVDYQRTEILQFEDDDYYYYVKAVPKLSVAESNKNVKHINSKTHN